MRIIEGQSDFLEWQGQEKEFNGWSRKVAVSEIEFSSNLETRRHAAITLRCSTNDPSLQPHFSFPLSLGLRTGWFRDTAKISILLSFTSCWFHLWNSTFLWKEYSSWSSSSRKIKIDILTSNCRALMMSEQVVQVHYEGDERDAGYY